MANALTGMPLEEAATATKTDLVYIPGRVVAKDARNIEGRAMTRCLMTGAGMTTVLQAQALKNVRMKSMTNGALRAKTTVMFGTCDDFPDQPTAEGVTDIVGLATVYFVTGTEGLVTICLMTGRVTVITSGTNDVTEITGVGDPPFMSTAAVSLPRPVGTDLGRLAVVIVALINVLIVVTLRADRAVERGPRGSGARCCRLLPRATGSDAAAAARAGRSRLPPDASASCTTWRRTRPRATRTDLLAAHARGLETGAAMSIGSWTCRPHPAPTCSSASGTALTVLGWARAAWPNNSDALAEGHRLPPPAARACCTARRRTSRSPAAEFDRRADLAAVPQ